MMFWYGAHYVFWQAVLMWIAMLAFWGLVIGAIWAISRGWYSRPRPGDEALAGAQQILDMRLARGEISPDDYRRLRTLIEDRTVANSPPM
jgi:uncharacterized membrane protein